MEPFYYILGGVIALMMTAPMMCVYNLYHKRYVLSALWFAYLFSASVIVSWRADMYTIEIAASIADFFAEYVVREIERMGQGGQL